MDSDLRASLAAAGAAFVLSALVGLFSRVGFAPLVGRAFVGGLVFGALVFGTLRFARSTLPGLGNRAAPGGPDSTYSDLDRGKNLDIVLPGEGPVGYADSVLVEGAEPGAVSQDEEEAETLVDIGEGVEAPPGGAPPRDPADVMAAKAFAAYEEDDAEAPGSLLDDSAAAAVPTSSVAASPGPRIGTGLDELDVLPDLEGFSDSFATPEYNASDAVSDGSSGFTSGRSGSGRQADTAGLDPAAMAQAVRTILKRDTKG